MSVKELTQLKITDLLKEYKRSFRDYWEMHDEAIKELKRKHIEITLEVERSQIISCKSHERTIRQKDYRNGYWKRWITLKDGRIEIKMPRIRVGG